MAKSVPHVLRLVKLRTETAFHFRNAAAGARAQAGGVGEQIARQIIVCTHAWIPRKPTVPQIRLFPFVLGRRSATIQDHAALLVDAAQAPAGWRTPSYKKNRPPEMSRVERAAYRAGQIEKPEWEYSARGMRNLEAKAELHTAILKRRQTGVDPKYLSAHARRRKEEGE
jgi:hypothetical protein